MSILDMAKRVAGCYESRYGRLPELQVGSGGDNVKVDFSIAKLESLGFFPNGSIDEEISGTLALCEGFAR